LRFVLGEENFAVQQLIPKPCVKALIVSTSYGDAGR
jgi:hypothetical protein